MRCLFLLCATLLTGCGYAPPAHTDTDSTKYQADLDACETSVPDAVDKHNAKTGLAWMAGGVTRWPRIQDGIGACMAERGWGRVRACTAEELRQGGAAGSLTVTREGIRCADPNRPG